MEAGMRVIGLVKPVNTESGRFWETVGFGLFVGEQIPTEDAAGVETGMRRDNKQAVNAFAMDDGNLIFDTEVSFYPAGSISEMKLEDRLIQIDINELRKRVRAL